MRNTTMPAATTGAGSAGPHASRPPQPLPRTTGDCLARLGQTLAKASSSG